MTKDEFRKAVDDVIEDCIRNDYTFGSYAHRVTDAVWPLFEAAETELAELRSSMKFRTSLIGRTEAERDALRAKIEEMERQEPYSYIYEYSNPIDGSPVWRDKPGYWNAQFPKSSKPLYLAPGAQAQPAPSVPDKVGVREDKEGEIFSRGSYNEGYDNGWNDCIDAMLAAARERRTSHD